MPTQQVGNKPGRDAKGRLLPGNTANPGGRAPGVSLTDALRAHVDKEELARLAYELTQCKDRGTRLRAIQWIYDRLDGRLPETRRLIGDEEEPLIVEMRYVKDWRGQRGNAG